MKSSPLRFRIFALLLVFIVGSAGVKSQLEINPYFGLVTGEREVLSESPIDLVTSYTGDRPIFGVDVLVGSHHLVPLFGIAYQPNSLEGSDGSTGRQNFAYLPLGVGYRLRQACTSFNLVVSAAAVPAMRLGDSELPADIGETGFELYGRLAATLYFDMVTLGVQFYPRFGGDVTSVQGRPSVTSLTLGGRF